MSDEIEHDKPDTITRLRAEVERLRAAQQWRPIESAPKEQATSVLLFAPYGVMYCGRWRQGGLGEPQQNIIAWRSDSSGRFANPTHWFPLPPPPENTNERE